MTNADVQAKIYEQESDKTRSPAPLAARRSSQPAPSPRDAASTPVMTPKPSVKLNCAQRRLTLGSRQSAITPSTPSDPPLAMTPPSPPVAPESKNKTSVASEGNTTVASKGDAASKPVEAIPPASVDKNGKFPKRTMRLVTIGEGGKLKIVRKSLADYDKQPVEGISRAQYKSIFRNRDGVMIGNKRHWVLTANQVIRHKAKK